MRHSNRYCQTGYVIELGRELYFKEWKDRRIRCVASPYRARHYRTQDEAEMDAQKYLGYAGLAPCICEVCWVLVFVDSLEGEWQYWCGEAFCPHGKDAMRFSCCADAENYRQQHGLKKTAMAELYCFRDKKITLAA